MSDPNSNTAQTFKFDFNKIERLAGEIQEMTREERSDSSAESQNDE